ncbi:MAG: nucleoside hydrolase [Clostridia bacterium]
MIKKIPVIIGADTGIDDAVGILLAIQSRKLDIKLINCSAGNVAPSQVSENTIKILDFVGNHDVRVSMGSTKPFGKPGVVPHVHGQTGLGNYEFEQASRLGEENGIKIMSDIILSSTEKITIIETGPLTDIAFLIRDYPMVKDNIERIVFMGGSTADYGNEVPYAGFNVACDPEAADFVFKSGVKIDLVPMEMGHTAFLDYKDISNTKKINYIGAMLEIVYRSYNDRHVKNGIATHDGCAVAYVICPKIYKTKQAKVEVKYYNNNQTGIAVCDFNSNEPNMTICYEIDVKAFKKLYFNMLKKAR